MSVTMDQVLTKLSSVEPDYNDAASLGPDALPHLELLAEGADTLIAAKAISLAGMIDTGRSVELLWKASQSATPEIRVQAAWSAGHLSSEAAQRILVLLLVDADAGVRSVSLRSSRKAFPRGNVPVVIQQKIVELSTDDPEPAIRKASTEWLK